MANSLDGLPAKSLRVHCIHCRGTEFIVLGRAPPGLVHGQKVEQPFIVASVLECAQCGEQYGFTEPRGIVKLS